MFIHPSLKKRIISRVKKTPFDDQRHPNDRRHVDWFCGRHILWRVGRLVKHHRHRGDFADANDRVALHLHTL